MNFGKRGASISVGPRGARVTVGNGRTTVSSGIPGTGIYYRKTVSSRKKASPRPQYATPNNVTPKRINAIGWLLITVVLVPSVILLATGHILWGFLGLFIFAILGPSLGQEPVETPQAAEQQLAHLKAIEQIHEEYEQRKPVFDEASRKLDEAETMADVDEQIAICENFMMWTYDMKDAGAYFTMPCTREESIEKISSCYNGKCYQIASNLADKCVTPNQAKQAIPQIVDIITKVRDGHTKADTLGKLQQVVAKLSQI